MLKYDDVCKIDFGTHINGTHTHTFSSSSKEEHCYRHYEYALITVVDYILRVCFQGGLSTVPLLSPSIRSTMACLRL